MSCGSREDFHQGLQARIGAPSFEFRKAMKAERCIKGGCDYEFTTKNYHVTTCAKKEGEILMGERECPKEDMGHGRTPRSVADMKDLPLAKKAGLEEVEIIAIILYSGPLFQVYNTVLRRPSRPICNVFQSFGNFFSTTIHVLVSVIIETHGVPKPSKTLPNRSKTQQNPTKATPKPPHGRFW